MLGTMVWDTIEHPDGAVVERWGGITYSLAAAAAAAPETWTIRPIIRVGADLAEEAWAFLESVPHLELPGGVVEVEEPNNRVHLRYRDRHHRDEQLTGGVCGWGWSALKPRLEGLDGLFVNLISGFELDAQTVTRLRDGFAGFRYVDLHSLVLDVDEDGLRVPRRPEQVEVWLGAFHGVQLNEWELGIIAGNDEPETVARAAVREGARAVLVTRGPEGARWFAREVGALWPAARDPGGADVRSGEVTLDTPWSTGDPTGCGDVWGATCFTALMEGRPLGDAMRESNRAAARNVDHRGADGLYQHLRAGS